MSSNSDSSQNQASLSGSSSKRHISSSYSSVTTHCWPIVDFKKQWMEACDNDQKALFGDTFSLISRPRIRLALKFNSTKKVWSNNWRGLCLKDLGGNKTVEIDYKIWFQNDQGQQFSIIEYFKQIFDSKCKSWGRNELSKEDAALLGDLYENHETLYFCCQVTDLSALVEDDHEKFLMNHWAMFEHGDHDAVIKVGTTEFKILKAYFIAQSEVFSRMFSASFREGQTNVVEVRDINEQTMKALIKWVYTGQIERESLTENLFEAADKYDIKLLKKLCVGHLHGTTNKTNAIWRLKLAVMHNENQLKDSALFYISQMSATEVTQMLTNPKWTAFSHKNIAISDEVNKLISDKMSGLNLE